MKLYASKPNLSFLSISIIFELSVLIDHALGLIVVQDMTITNFRKLGAMIGYKSLRYFVTASAIG